MSTLKTTSITHGSNSGTANLVLNDTGNLEARKVNGCQRIVLEQFYSPCDGSVIALQDGNHTLTQPSAYDATDLIEIEYEPLTVVHDPLSSLDNSSIKVHEHLNNNLICKNIFGEENKHVFNKADHVVKIKLVNQRVAPLPMETRGVVVTYEPNGVLKMWISTQGPFLIRDDISKVLKIPTNRIQVIAPDV